MSSAGVLYVMLNMKRPRSISLIAIIFIILGSLSAIEMVYALFSNSLNIQFTVLMIPIGLGLWKGRSSSRSWAKFWIGLFFITSALLLLLYPFVGDTMIFRWIDKEIFGLPRLVFAIGYPISVLLLSRWMWTQLTSPNFSPFFDDYLIERTSLEQTNPSNETNKIA